MKNRTIFSIADDLEQLHNYLRIMREMLTEQLCGYSVDDVESMGLSLERTHFLVNLIPEKLAHMASLNAELFSLSKEKEPGLIAAKNGQNQNI